jgi:hypothetical protein
MAVYNGVGNYTLHLIVIPGLTNLDVVPVGTVIDASTGGFTLTDAPGFSVDHVIIGILITDGLAREVELLDRPPRGLCGQVDQVGDALLGDLVVVPLSPR